MTFRRAEILAEFEAFDQSDFTANVAMEASRRVDLSRQYTADWRARQLPEKLRKMKLPKSIESERLARLGCFKREKSQ